MSVLFVIHIDGVVERVADLPAQALEARNQIAVKYRVPRTAVDIGRREGQHPRWFNRTYWRLFDRRYPDA